MFKNLGNLSKINVGTRGLGSCGTIPCGQVSSQMWLTTEEFTQYRQYFYPCKNEVKNKDLFFSAWRHHKDNNIHHWQNWTTKCKGYAYRDSYVVMMLVDWVAMGFEFNDTAQEYYEKNKGTIDLPEWAEELMYRIFEQIYPS